MQSLVLSHLSTLDWSISVISQVTKHVNKFTLCILIPFVSNLFKVAGGHSDTQNGRGGKRKTTAKVAASCEAST